MFNKMFNKMFKEKVVELQWQAGMIKLVKLLLYGALLLAATLQMQQVALAAEAVEGPSLSQGVCKEQVGGAAEGPLGEEVVGCTLDEQQPAFAGAVNFGGAVVLGQTFNPDIHGRVCKVTIRIRKNLSTTGALKLSVLRADFSVLDAAAIAGGAIPVGISDQTFEFNCDGGLLNNAPFYGLKLESPTSAFGAYSWYGIHGNLYARGAGYSNPNAGAGAWDLIPPGDWDYTFKIYMCPP
ncbi:MAG: hypothetical protein HY326_05175 [Chloroflexi bacterium]|nr:hypothetical protein [Chloroflexota bacterium]